jgi:hypothetical protein
MISSFASETARPAIFLPEQDEVLAHGGLLGNLFYRSLQILVRQGSQKRENFHVIERRRSLVKTQIDRSLRLGSATVVIAADDTCYWNGSPNRRSCIGVFPEPHRPRSRSRLCVTTENCRCTFFNGVRRCVERPAARCRLSRST